MVADPDCRGRHGNACWRGRSDGGITDNITRQRSRCPWSILEPEGKRICQLLVLDRGADRTWRRGHVRPHGLGWSGWKQRAFHVVGTAVFALSNRLGAGHGKPRLPGRPEYSPALLLPIRRCNRKVTPTRSLLGRAALRAASLPTSNAASTFLTWAKMRSGLKTERLSQ